MAITSTVLFESPQFEIASLIKDKFSKANVIKIVTGFLTVEGVKALESALIINYSALEVLVIGAGTYKAYVALDHLIDIGVPNSNLLVHLGHSRLTKPGASHSFYRYHPMLHSKIYYTEHTDNTACAFIGSHNITGFALMGLNGEASVMLEGDVNDLEFSKIRKHIDEAKNQSIVYEPGMKEAFSWWSNQFFQGLEQKTHDIPKESEGKKTILIFCQYKKDLPKKDDILYFELFQAIGTIQSMRAEVHLFIFDKLPNTPQECLMNLRTAKNSFWCKTEGIENNKGGKELSTDWYIDESSIPTLTRAPKPFRPNPKADKQQIRVKLLYPVYGKFDYLFGKQIREWLPQLNDEKQVSYNQSFSTEIVKLNLIPPETNKWLLVTGLVPKDEALLDEDKAPYQLALKAMEPESGAFILFSTGRRKIEKS